jgi:hypothetical protein
MNPNCTNYSIDRNDAGNSWLCWCIEHIFCGLWFFIKHPKFCSTVKLWLKNRTLGWVFSGCYILWSTRELVIMQMFGKEIFLNRKEFNLFHWIIWKEKGNLFPYNCCGYIKMLSLSYIIELYTEIRHFEKGLAVKYKLQMCLLLIEQPFYVSWCIHWLIIIYSGPCLLRPLRSEDTSFKDTAENHLVLIQ